jgi:hypothetical protein
MTVHPSPAFKGPYTCGYCETEVTVKKLIVLATAVAALAVGAATVVTLSSAANPKLVVSCEGNSCSVQLPGALLDEMNQTMTKSLSEPAESETADERAFLKGLGQPFGQPPTPA